LRLCADGNCDLLILGYKPKTASFIALRFISQVPPVWPGGKLSQFDLELILTTYDETALPPSRGSTQGTGESEADVDEWCCAQSLYQHRGRRVALVIKGASSAVEVFMNGVWVGCSKDSFLECEFDVTNALLKGPSNNNSNKEHSSAGGGGPFDVLALRVAHWSDLSYLEDQDQWWLSSLHRSVELHCLPAVHFASLSATTQHLAWTSTTSGGASVAAALTDDASIIDPVDQQSKMSFTPTWAVVAVVVMQRTQVGTQQQQLASQQRQPAKPLRRHTPARKPSTARQRRRREVRRLLVVRRFHCRRLKRRRFPFPRK